MEDEKILTTEATEQTEEKKYTPRPKWAFDDEYKTERRREVEFLAQRGINYTFEKVTHDYNVSQYKYKKTPALFAALVEFYTRLEVEREFKPRRKTEYRETKQQDTLKEMQDKMDQYAAQIAEIKTKLQDDTE